MNLVIVESPAKAKTINRYLGSDYTVLASFGHVRDLPSKNGSVEPDQDFAMKWEVDAKSNKRLNEIAKVARESDHVYLATDPDREGEAISWHVLEVLNQKKALGRAKVQRVVFNEITKSAILKAMTEPREIDKELVNAYLARRALDYLVGFTLSPVLWRKLPGARSAGRVQSVTLRLICDRELEIDKFIAQEYWSVTADMLSAEGQPFTARLVHLNGEKLDKMDLGNEEAARAAVAAIEAGEFTVSKVDRRPTRRNPQPPFTTSTLQQEASRKLGFSASQAMRTAQSLYEGKTIDGETTGLITYMRTDGVQIAGEAIAGARALISESYGARFLPDEPRIYKSKAKNAQEAHEAIRPTSMMRRPTEMARYLEEDERRLYELIWKRTIASQMASAQIERTSVTITSGDGQTELRASGSVIQFEGFLKLYQEGFDDRNAEAGEKGDENRLPRINEGETPPLKGVTPRQHFTEPPPRFSEASLVKKMEELGIGRPSTYASTLSVLRERNYVHMDKKRFIPEDKGHVVIAFLESFFGRWVEYDFTASLEEELDRISAGQLEWKSVLRDFWSDFHPKTEEVLAVSNTEVLENLNEHLKAHVFKETEPGVDPRKCQSCDNGRLSLKTGRFGAFIGCSNYPECRFTRQLTGDTKGNGATAEGPKVLGQDPETGLDVTLREGRFGPYFQLGEQDKEDKKSKPKRASLPKDMSPDQVDFEQALKLLSLPREVGMHPETEKMITAAIGRYGPYILHDGKYASLTTTEEVFSVGVNRAVVLLAEAKNKVRRGPQALKELGDHPEDGKAVRVMDGRYGPYVKHNAVNATIPRGTDPEDVNMDMAVALLKARIAKGPAKKKARPKKKKSAAKSRAKPKTKPKAKEADE